MKNTSYAEKLKTLEWLEFRDSFIRRHTRENELPCCHACSNSRNLQVHHRRYKRGKEPWEYDDEDLVLICGDCHETVHSVAREFYDWLISIPPYEIREASDLLEELVRCKIPASAMAHCKNAVRSLNYSVARPSIP